MMFVLTYEVVVAEPPLLNVSFAVAVLTSSMGFVIFEPALVIATILEYLPSEPSCILVVK